MGKSHEDYCQNQVNNKQNKVDAADYLGFFAKALGVFAALSPLALENVRHNKCHHAECGANAQGT